MISLFLVLLAEEKSLGSIAHVYDYVRLVRGTAHNMKDVKNCGKLVFALKIEELTIEMIKNANIHSIFLETIQSNKCSNSNSK